MLPSPLFSRPLIPAELLEAAMGDPPCSLPGVSLRSSVAAIPQRSLSLSLWAFLPPELQQSSPNFFNPFQNGFSMIMRSWTLGTVQGRGL